ncbi:glutamate 5-kinase [Pedobacter sp. UYP30]|uniref:glutamate 5-kinase n=1 Tax=Pedobacter sp. UYP30 TaxID=1756400 RepID=UPI0033907BB2
MLTWRLIFTVYKAMALVYKKIVVKIGSNVLTKPNGLPDEPRLQHLVNQLTNLMQRGIEVILVSSGAVAFGRSLNLISEKIDAVKARQVLAATGQIKLINAYAKLFGEQQISSAQVLVTKEDFRDRTHYLNMKNCMQTLLQHHIIPIVNENDVVAITELMFTDNDELAGLIASMLNAEALFVLTNVDGLYDGDPALENTQVITQIDREPVALNSFVAKNKSSFGRGGMATKLSMSQKISKLGIAVHIANGKTDHILTDLFDGSPTHTHFIPGKKKSGKKRWIAHSENAAKGAVKVNNGAKAALSVGKAISILPVGVIEIISDFAKGDVIKILDEDNQNIGLGIAEYGSDKAKEQLGQAHQKPLVHCDYFFSLL